VSLPTARLAEAAGLLCHAFAREAALALANGAHVPVDAIFEEQLPEGRLDRYTVLVAAGVAATYPATRGLLRGWIERGGTLILVGEAMELDEYARPSPSDFPGITLGEEIGGEPQPVQREDWEFEAAPYRSMELGEGWKPIGFFKDGSVAIAKRDIGRGNAIYVGCRFPESSREGRELFLLGILGHPVNPPEPVCTTLDPDTRDPVPDIEVHAARGADGDVGFVVENRSLAAKAVRFVPWDRDRALSLTLVDVTRRTILGPDRDGAVLLLLEPSVPVVLRGFPSPPSPQAPSP
jgi:hypothetical protein